MFFFCTYVSGFGYQQYLAMIKTLMYSEIVIHTVLCVHVCVYLFHMMAKGQFKCLVLVFHFEKYKCYPLTAITISYCA